MVAREHPETAGIDRQALVETELGGEVGDEEVGRAAALAPPRLLAAVPGKPGLDPGQVLEVVRLERLLEFFVRQLGEERDRVVVKGGEPSRLEVHEEAPRLGDPREREVARDLEECCAQRRAVVYLGHERAP